MIGLDTDAAVADLKNRTLSALPGEVARLLYLASTRDYSTGEYFHDGLASEFSGRAASEALTHCHRETFAALALSPLEQLVAQVSTYVTSTGAETEDVVRFWRKVEPYRVAVPADADSLAVELFASNVRIALEILASRQAREPSGQQSAWQPPSLGQ